MPPIEEQREDPLLLEEVWEGVGGAGGVLSGGGGGGMVEVVEEGGGGGAVEEIAGRVDEGVEIGVLDCCEGLLVVELIPIVALAPLEEVMKPVGEAELAMPL